MEETINHQLNGASSQSNFQAGRAQGKRGRKPANESRAAEIRTRLLVWKRTPSPQRVSLRALATEIGTSHQLLSFHLRRLEKWQIKEYYRRKAQEIPDNRPLTKALYSMIGPAICKMLAGLESQIKCGALSGNQVKIAKLLARQGIGKAQEILNLHFQRKDNLPLTHDGTAKSFRRT
jgi:hypothetical protein